MLSLSSINIKSGTNWILPCRTKRSMTLDLQKQMIWFKTQQEEQLFRFNSLFATFADLHVRKRATFADLHSYTHAYG